MSRAGGPNQVAEVSVAITGNTGGLESAIAEAKAKLAALKDQAGGGVGGGGGDSAGPSSVAETLSSPTGLFVGANINLAIQAMSLMAQLHEPLDRLVNGLNKFEQVLDNLITRVSIQDSKSEGFRSEGEKRQEGTLSEGSLQIVNEQISALERANTTLKEKEIEYQASLRGRLQDLIIDDESEPFWGAGFSFREKIAVNDQELQKLREKQAQLQERANESTLQGIAQRAGIPNASDLPRIQLDDVTRFRIINDESGQTLSMFIQVVERMQDMQRSLKLGIPVINLTESREKPHKGGD